MMHLPYEILNKIFVLVPNIYNFKLVNRWFKFIIESITSDHLYKINKITKKWTKDTKLLIDNLVKNDNIDTILFLLNNLVKNENDEYKVKTYLNFYAGYYNNIELINSHLTTSYQIILNGAANAGNLDLIKKYKDKIFSMGMLCSYAALNAQKNIINYVKKTEIIDYHILVCHFAEGGHLDLVIETVLKIKNVNVLLYNMIAVSAAIGGKLNIIEWAFQEGASDIALIEIIVVATENGFLDIIKWAVNRGIYIMNRIAYIAALNGHIHILKWLIEELKYDSLEDIAITAAEGGHLDIIEYLKIDNQKILNGVANIAASNNHFDIVKYAINKGASDLSEIAISATINENLYIVNYIYNIDSKILNDVAFAAASLGIYKIVKYAINKGASNILEMAFEAAEGGHLEIFKYITDNRIKDFEKLKDAAKLYGHYNIVNYIEDISA